MAAALGVFALAVAPPDVGLPALGLATIVVLWPSSAGRWAAGAAGERRTKAALAGIEQEGWTALHDVRAAGKRWNATSCAVTMSGRPDTGGTARLGACTRSPSTRTIGRCTRCQASYRIEPYGRRRFT